MVSYIFGPVPSRRLGRSLGVDLVPFKTCSYDCIYCQLARTTCKTIERKEWVSLDAIISELQSRLQSKPDYITLSGSGEPTLYARTSELIARIKEITQVPVAVLSNGSLFWRPEVRQSVSAADVVIPSLDAGSEELFQKINRPHSEITFAKMLQGLIELRQEYRGQYWLEVFFLNGLNTALPEIQRIAECVQRINPHRVQLNTVTRPPTEDFALAVSPEKLQEIAEKIAPNAEIIADYRHIDTENQFTTTREDIVNMLRRRPCSAQEIADVFGLHQNEVLKHLEKLTRSGKIVPERRADKTYYKTPANREQK